MKLRSVIAALLMATAGMAGAAGDAAKGKALYASCAGCHGADGMGQAALNSPRLAGQLEGYLVTQLKNFKSGVRGAAEGDAGGRMMAPMAAILADDQAIEDVAAYLASL